MSLRLRLILLPVALLLLTGLITLLSHRSERQREIRYQDHAREILQQNLQHWISPDQTGLPEFTQAYGERRIWVDTGDGSAAERGKPTRGMPPGSWEVDGVWVFRASGQIIHEDVVPRHPPLALPLTPETVWETFQQTDSPHFFRRTPAGLLELFGSRVPPPDDQNPAHAPMAWLLVGRLWDDGFLTRLQPDRNYRVSVRFPATDRAEPLLDSDRAELPLLNEYDEIVGYAQVLHLHLDSAADPEGGIDPTLLVLLWGSAGSLLLAGLAHRWVVRPLAQINAALTTHQEPAIAALTQRQDEFARIGRLIADSSARDKLLQAETQRRRESEHALRHSEAALRHTLDQRTKLGLDLHDSTIQILYASGLSLAAAEMRLATIAPDERQTIQSIRQNLQQAVDDLRRFIDDAEIEKAPHTLTDAIETMLALMRNTNQVEIHHQIDSDVSQHLTANQRVQLLQILRECITNTIRHARARAIWISLIARPGRVRLRVEDDGIGLPPVPTTKNSRGLTNMHHRARSCEALLTFSPRPAGGTRIDLEFKTT